MIASNRNGLTTVLLDGAAGVIFMSRFFSILALAISIESFASSGDCIDHMTLSSKYPSLWVEELRSTGVFSGILSVEPLLILNERWEAEVSLLKTELHELRSASLPESKNDQRNHVEKVFSLMSKLAKLEKEHPYFHKNIEFTERLFIARLGLAHNNEISKELRSKGQCLPISEYRNKLIGEIQQSMKKIIKKASR
ncbi:hypothetical protein [Microbulbifer discodermiae]|uniref:hypothetical protein n=1 Tax=Microbulbifer sp. 2201CG32-9 TaxID=3232309 RepID=UPI00345BD32C